MLREYSKARWRKKRPPTHPNHAVFTNWDWASADGWSSKELRFDAPVWFLKIPRRTPRSGQAAEENLNSRSRQKRIPPKQNNALWTWCVGGRGWVVVFTSIPAKLLLTESCGVFSCESVLLQKKKDRKSVGEGKSDEYGGGRSSKKKK
eukprot:RCo001880